MLCSRGKDWRGKSRSLGLPLFRCFCLKGVPFSPSPFPSSSVAWGTFCQGDATLKRASEGWAAVRRQLHSPPLCRPDLFHVTAMLCVYHRLWFFPHTEFFIPECSFQLVVEWPRPQTCESLPNTRVDFLSFPE